MFMNIPIQRLISGLKMKTGNMKMFRFNTFINISFANMSIFINVTGATVAEW